MNTLNSRQNTQQSTEKNDTLSDNYSTGWDMINSANINNAKQKTNEI